MKRPLDEGHQDTRAFLRVLGPGMAVVGGILIAIGLGSFFVAFGSSGPPRYFWCAFVGMPLLGIGLMITKFAYMGRIARYVAGEVAPVGKDTINYMADGTKDSVRELASAVGEGLRAGTGAPGPAETKTVLRCHKCNAENDVDASFCDSCGEALTKSKPCAHCAELNDPDARFCDACGKPIE